MTHVVGMFGTDGTSVEFDWHKIALERGEEIVRLRQALADISEWCNPLSEDMVIAEISEIVAMALR